MKTLVYFASGENKQVYQDLDFDKIYLVDNCFRRQQNRQNLRITAEKVQCIGMDCLASIDFFLKNKVKIDCFVALNEGLYEGGGSYALNSDMFLGYAMPLFKEKYIHIMNKKYYHNHYKVSMDLPYYKEEILENDARYLSPFLFSSDSYHKGNAKVFEMTKNQHISTYNLPSNLKVSLIHDSIWNYYHELDLLISSLDSQGQRDFFHRIPKVQVFAKNAIRIEEILAYCIENQITKIGFTPWGFGKYEAFVESLSHYNFPYPLEIMLFHLNKGDYSELRKLLA